MGSSDGGGSSPAAETPAEVPAAGVTAPPSDPALPASDPGHHVKASGPALVLAALGVVYGDIGTSPLYAIRECFHGPHAAPITSTNVLGVMSLVFWFLISVISIKYVAFVMRADNRGEGGMMSLMALVGIRAGQEAPRGSPRWILVLLGLFGTALLYGEGVLTPAISVLSAVEGLGVVTHAFDKAIVPITCVIIVLLFLVQRRGTATVGAVFGPVMVAWFVVLSALGLGAIWKYPAILGAINPRHALAFFQQEGLHSLRTLGSVVLVITGGEALYADMGHFSASPVRRSWFFMVFPALLLNYLGQGAALLANLALAPAAGGEAYDKWKLTQETLASDLFYNLAPSWALIPLVGLATMATVIASQALISASFSLTRQAVQLGYFPRVQIVHTSSAEIGQIYVPFVNWVLMFACLGLVLGFKTSSNLASAYGLAVTAVMSITSVLFFAVARTRWNWPLWKAGGLTAVFLTIDLSNFVANSLKLFDGGWFPLAMGVGIFTLMTTWKRGREILSLRLKHTTLPMDAFIEDLEERKSVQRVPGTAVFMSGARDGVPHAMLHNLKHNKVLHERNVMLTLTSEEIPFVDPKERLELEELAPGFIRFIAHYGFMETPNVLELLEFAKKKYKFEYRLNHTTFFLGRETLIATKRKGMAIWRERLFAWMSLNARSATQFFGLPPNRVVEMGAQIEL